LRKDEYQLSFQSELTIIPDSLSSSIKRSLSDISFNKDYVVEVIDCSSKEISYSFMITKNVENNLVPCLGRDLPLNCYLVNVYFQRANGKFYFIKLSSLFVFILCSLLGFTLHFREKAIASKVSAKELGFTVIGNYKFYKDQNRLVKEEVIIKLTAKECELIEILGERQNQIVKRDILVKKVWEDNGVIVGRSLDTYISKIRKKLKDDDSVKIVNIHGVGYRLEIV
ncbi:MAG: helix-turn-helix domain-containing protein, partial [Bacteroidetes bacterium]|nr:helix-turn-helix domain-containing protein [Bacteroidota bacterium]